ncbi:chloroplastic import inner membrane translocase subunit TIM22-2 [Physcomitrium patens]|uniref:Uncharacterized protein n=1 Tax=Physcomitrium patens TaxID=3218 RepID=A0A2K1IGK5_PHYPA|nr:mitochondrial import inner membrane translocase subunit TIM22-2-like [Physcomitrium patens]PNR28400.1 hypothetical protein PHYPA_028992 [Physcomitrium patens]|eukprot:XP_024363374.1 mitochondrial import inner membrane translocase subunit TIM22-2-like [Physcomitrella patens]
MAMVPSGGGDDVSGGEGGSWTNSDDGLIDSSSSASQEPGSWSVGGPNHPTFCFFKGAADGLAGGLMGSVFGFGSGLFKKQGFKGALREGGSSAKTFAILSGVHSIVSCYLKKVRGKEDAWNAGIAGCATGLALSAPGSPQALAQSCLSFGAFSFVLEYMNHTRPAIAATVTSVLQPSSSRQFNIINHHHWHLNMPALPPFTLPPLSFPSQLSFLNLESANRTRPL